MIRQLVLFLSWLLPLWSTVIAEEPLKSTTGPVPAWVKPYDFSLDPPPQKPSQLHLQHLLNDTQKNYLEKAIYIHSAIKVLDSVGIENVSQLRFVFNPSYERVVVHTIRIFRNGECLDRLESSRHSLLQREEALDQKLYYGYLTSLYFIPDVRVGDILEYSWTILGMNPLFVTHIADMIYLQAYHIEEKLCRRLLLPSGHPVSSKFFHFSLKPSIVDLTPEMQEWSWELESVDPVPNDPWEPSWYNPFARLQLTQYQSWQEVADKLLPLYTLAEDFKDNPSDLILAFVEKCKETTSSPTERALLALRFVQDEVQYLGFENDITSYKPADPRLVFQRRFGDCKDKTILLQSLLSLMDIPSFPVLVHLNIGRCLPDFLPTHQVFNHIVLCAFIEGLPYWMDSTLTLQGGSLENQYFPSLHWGLPLTPESGGLVALPEYSLERPIENRTLIKLISLDSAELSFQETYVGLDADQFRRELKISGSKGIEKKALNIIRKDYRGVIALTPLSISDDRQNNCITLTASYRIAVRSRAGKKLLPVISQTVCRYLDKEITLDRSSPYALVYPLWIHENIRIENPLHPWKANLDFFALEHESFRYQFSLAQDGANAVYNFELQHLKDHVPTEAIKEYWEMMSQIEQRQIMEVEIIPTSVR